MGESDPPYSKFQLAVDLMPSLLAGMGLAGMGWQSSLCIRNSCFPFGAGETGARPGGICLCHQPVAHSVLLRCLDASLLGNDCLAQVDEREPVTSYLDDPVTKGWSHLVPDTKLPNPRYHLSLSPLSGWKEIWCPIPSQERDAEVAIS